MSIPVVCAILLRAHPLQVMIAQRPEGKHLALKWEFPGGKVEQGESPEAALVRELQEELGCRVHILAPLRWSEHDYERGSIQMIPFVCELEPGSPEPRPLEHRDLAWVSPAELRTYDLAAADYPVVLAFEEWEASARK